MDALFTYFWVCVKSLGKTSSGDSGWCKYGISFHLLNQVYFVFCSNCLSCLECHLFKCIEQEVIGEGAYIKNVHHQRE